MSLYHLEILLHESWGEAGEMMWKSQSAARNQYTAASQEDPGLQEQN